MGRHSLARGLQKISRIDLPPTFLAPSLQFLSHRQASFSTSASPLFPRRDLSRNRGVSAIHRSGVRWKLEASKVDLPVPVSNAATRLQFKTNPSHGLWGFFNDQKTSLNTIEEDHAHGWSLESNPTPLTNSLVT